MRREKNTKSKPKTNHTNNKTMGKKAVKLYFRVLGLAFTIVVSIFTFMALYGGDDVPAKSIFHAMLTVTLPLWMICNALLIAWWAIRMKWYLAIPIATLCCCWNYAGTLWRPGDGESINTDKQLLRVATYNAARFSKDGTGVIASDIKNGMLREGTEIICLQEYYGALAGQRQKTARDLFLPEYKYCTRHRGDVVILSTYPILDEGVTEWEGTNASFIWADIKVSESKTVRVYNMHLQSTAINSNLRRATNEGMVDESQNIQNSAVYDLLAEGYAWGLNVRSGQAIEIANSKRLSPHDIIVCGDMNDVPYSFAYNTVKGDLDDGFVTAGGGWASTYKGAKGMMRIDYIMHSQALKGAQYYSRDWEYSDHNPVFMSFIKDF